MPVQVPLMDLYEHPLTRLGTAGFVKRLYSVGYKWPRARPLSLRGGWESDCLYIPETELIAVGKVPNHPGASSGGLQTALSGHQTKKETASFGTVSFVR